MVNLRIQEHPILGTIEKGRKVKFEFDGRIIEGYEGEPIAFALRSEGITALRYTMRKHKPRGIFCAIGRCTDCVMIVDGKPNIRTCITPLKDGMKVQTQYGITPKRFSDMSD
jgi:predicted molibdopterin-dependent oxidoreductase YjgC